MARAALWWLTLPAALAAVATWTDYLPAKMGVPLACGALVSWLAATGRIDSLTGWSVVAAFIASAGGDYFLSNKRGNEGFFLVGIALYLVAHAGYLAAAWRNGGVNVVVLAVSLAVFFAYYAALLRPAIEGAALQAAVLGYLTLSCLVLAVAAGIGWPVSIKVFFVAGIALIVLSDLVISFSEFLGVHALDFLILPAYYLAHLSITAALILNPPSS